MKQASRILMLVAVLTMAVVLGGCSTVDKQNYIKENNKIQQRAAKAMGKADPNDPKALDTAQAELDKAIADFKKLDVPKDYKDEHKDLVDSLTELSTTIGEIKTAVKDGDVNKLTSLQADMTKSQAKFNSAIDSINKDNT